MRPAALPASRGGCAMRKRFWPAAALLGLLAPWAQAQMIDEAELRAEGADAVLSVRMTTSVQYLRSVAARSLDLVQAFYNITPSRDPAKPLEGERRRLAALGSLPEITITDEEDKGRPGRKLVVRFSTAQRFTVRQGRGNNTIDVVIQGLGDAVRAAEALPRPAAEGAGKTVIVLARGNAPVGMDMPLPRALARYELVTDTREIEGRTEHRLVLRGFADREEAQRALRALERFPQARIEVEAAAAPPAVTATVAPAPTPATAAAPSSAPTPALLARARELRATGDNAGALAALEELLGQAGAAEAAEAQALIGDVRLALGDTVRARAEYETYLKLYPQGAEADRVRAQFAALPAPVAAVARPEKPAEAVQITASIAQTYYGGQSKTLTELKDTPLEGQIPQIVSTDTISGTDQNQSVTSLDFGWRQRDKSRDLRFVFRDSFTAEGMANRPSRNRLTALYVDYRALPHGVTARVGRQSGLGGGVLGRFDGATVGWAFPSRWKVSGVIGQPTDVLLDTQRHFYGVAVDTDSLLPGVGAGSYLIEQKIDGQIDRRALGLELRYFRPNANVFSIFESDLIMKTLNIASITGTFIAEDNSTINVLYDRRATPLSMLGNALFFPDPTATTFPRTVRDLLNTKTLEQLRQTVKDTTAFTTQGTAGFTRPLTEHWQAGLDARFTAIGEILPVPDVLPSGLAASRATTFGVQAIGTNLYSQRDTHVINVSYLTGHNSANRFLPAGPQNVAVEYSGWLASYNNLSVPWPSWQLEPSIRLYSQSTTSGIRTMRVTPGMRLTWRFRPGWSLESDLNLEQSKTTGPNQNESATRAYYYLGYRFDL